MVGPLGRLLTASTDLGPSHAGDAQLTAELAGTAWPKDLMGWAGEHGLSVRWRPGDNWAIVEGEAKDVGAAFGVAVHDFRGRRGQVFYASAQQPAVPASLRGSVTGLGEIAHQRAARHRGLAWPSIDRREVP